jgi:hypothetical protein
MWRKGLIPDDMPLSQFGELLKTHFWPAGSLDAPPFASRWA